MNKTIQVSTNINASIEKIWECWTDAQHIVHWNSAIDSWHCPNAENNCTDNGKFLWRMEAKDGSFGFDFKGRYLKVEKYKSIKAVLDDERNWEIEFKKESDGITIIETFEIENENTAEQQKAGWQAILNRFGEYVAG